MKKMSVKSVKFLEVKNMARLTGSKLARARRKTAGRKGKPRPSKKLDKATRI